MTVRIISSVLWFVLVCLTQSAAGFEDPNFSGAFWDGNVAFFAVPRERVTAKLAELQTEADLGCGADKLTLPNQPILPAYVKPDQHVVAVAFGTIHSTTVPEGQLDYVSTTTDTIQFYIPFLTGEDPDGDPVYKLALDSFVDTTDRPFANPNPDIPIEEAVYIDSSRSSVTVYIADGAEKLSLSTVWTDCQPLDEETTEVFEAYNAQYTLSFVHTHPCGCQYWNHSRLKTCNLGTLRVATITPLFEEFTLLTQSYARLSVVNSGIFRIGVKDPCF